MIATFDKTKQRMVNLAHFWIWNYLEVGDTLHAEQTAKKLQGIIRAFGNQRCGKSVKEIKVKK